MIFGAETHLGSGAFFFLLKLAIARASHFNVCWQ